MTETITGPLAFIDQMLADNAGASYKARRASGVNHPPHVLRLLSAEGEAYKLMRRDPAQTAEMTEFWLEDGAVVKTPPSFMLPQDVADVRVIFDDKPSDIDDRGWKLRVGHDSILLGDYYSGKGHPERKGKGTPLSPEQMHSFMNLLQTSQVISIESTEEMRQWYDGIRVVTAVKRAAWAQYTRPHPKYAVDF